MQPVKFSINVTLDGCIDHQVVPAAAVLQKLHENAAAHIAGADVLLLGRVTYQLMESAWRLSTWDPDRGEPGVFARTIDAAKKVVATRTLSDVDWNAEIVRDDLAATVRALKAQPGRGIFVGGAALAMSLTELRLIDEYEFVVHPRIVGHGPSLFAGLGRHVELQMLSCTELAAGTMLMRYTPAPPA